MGRQYVVVDIIKEEGVSAKTMDRPGWRKVEQLLRSGKADMVVSTSLDRMTRSVSGFLRFFEEVCESNNKSFETLQERFETVTAAGKMMFHMLLALSQFQREQTAEKVSGSRTSRSQRGLMTSFAPFGAMPGPTKGIPVKDPERWPWIERIFTMAAKGIPDSQIIAHLAEHGVTTVRGAQVGATTVARILQNRFYLGEVQNGEEWFPGQHDCRIDPKLWQAAQHKRATKPGPEPRAYAYLLEGLVFTTDLSITYPENRAGKPCPYGPRYSYGRHNKPYYYYLRADKHKSFGGIKVQPMNGLTAYPPDRLAATDLDQTVIEWVLEASQQGELRTVMQEALKQSRSREPEIRKQQEQLNRQLITARRKHEKIKKQAVDYVVSDKSELAEALNDELGELRVAIELLEAKIEGLDAAVAHWQAIDTDMQLMADHVDLIRDAWARGDVENLKPLLRTLIQSVNINVDGDGYRVELKLFALPNKAVNRLDTKVAPTGIEPVPPP